MLNFITWTADPILFDFSIFEVRWYSLMFLIGFLGGYKIVEKIFKHEGAPESWLGSLLIWVMAGTIIGARLGHVFFYEWDQYSQNPIDIFKVWEGGLASHGGTIAIIIGMWWFVKKYGRRYDFSYLWLLDRLAIATAFAAMFIRLGNLMNSEIYGHETSLPWGFIFLQNGETVPKHPTQLYEALCYLGTGILLFCLYKYALPKIKEGLLLGIFFIGIFFSRFLIEFVKENQVGFEEGMTLNMGQLLSIPFVLLGIFLIVRSFRPGTPPALSVPQKENGKR